jgi:tRNA A37 threonylcarbamoyltransferase TsaD
VSTDTDALVRELRLQFPDTPNHRDKLHREAADTIERLIRERDEAVAQCDYSAEDMRAYAAAAIEQAVARERERIAKECERIAKECDRPVFTHLVGTAAEALRAFAAAIRNTKATT